MKNRSRSMLSAFALAACFTLAHTPYARAQVFDTPALDFVLEPAEGQSQTGGNVSTVTAIGNFDLSVSVENLPTLNEVAVTGFSVFPSDTEIVHRFWTIVHDDASDTRSLVQSAPSDIVVNNPDSPFYQLPGSLQLADMNGDGLDDAVLQGIRSFGNGAVDSGKFISSGTGPAAVFGVPAQAGPNFFQTSINQLGTQTDGGIPVPIGNSPAMGTADFDGDGLQDVVFYDFENAAASGQAFGEQTLVVLANNGSFGTLPATVTVLNPPAPFQGFDTAVDLVAADIDGDGVPDAGMTLNDEENEVSALVVYKGNGDGTFQPDPIASIDLETTEVSTLAVGNFDGDDFLDFATVGDGDENNDPLLVVLCHPGSPASCELNSVTLSATVVAHLVAADFDEDGLDDLAAAVFTVNETALQITGGAEVRLNQGDGSFSAAAQQFIALPGANSEALHISAKEIDGCGGPDIAFTGPEIFIPTPTPSATPVALGEEFGFVNHAVVAFNHNDDPVADAGQPVQVDGRVQVGGEPTCSGELGETINIQWEVLSGSADISDPTAANPFVDATNSAVLQVTCTDLCGASSSSTVTVSGGFLLNGTGCSLGQTAVGGAAWLFGLIGLLPLAIRRIRR